MIKENTGNYRLCRHQVGIGGTIESLSEHKSKEEVLKSLNDIKKDLKWSYYCEEEVIYKGTQLDENRNPIDSAASWIRIV